MGPTKGHYHAMSTVSKKGCTVAGHRGPIDLETISAAVDWPAEFICMSPYYMVLAMRTGGCVGLGRGYGLV